MNPRHRARRLALQGLCCLDVQGEHVLDLVQEFIRDSRELPAALSVAEQLMQQTWADRAECDKLLTRHARHWGLDRLALVDRNILRLAACEMRSAAAPPKVIITEALRLTREFSSAESARFVNGVLDAVAREIGGEGNQQG